MYDELDHGQTKTIQTYQPASLTNIEETLRELRQKVKSENGQVLDKQMTSQSAPGAGSSEASPSKDPEITYTDDGQAFTDSSDSAGALLF